MEVKLTETRRRRKKRQKRRKGTGECSRQMDEEEVNKVKERQDKRERKEEIKGKKMKLNVKHDACVTYQWH